MKPIPHYSFMALGLLLFSCAEPRNLSIERPDRGSESFATALRIGFGSNHPAIPRAGSALSLTGDSGVVSLAVDPAADIWSAVQFDITQQSLISLDQSLVEWTRTYVASHKAELGLDVSELVSFAKTLYEPFPDQTYVTFQRQFQNREVRGAFVSFIFATDKSGHRLREIVNSSYGPINLRSTESAGVSAQVAVDSTGLSSLQPVAQKSLIYPQQGADGRYEFRLATEWELADQEHSENFKVILDDDSQSILAAASNHYHVKQQLQMETFKNSYVTNVVVLEPFYGVRVDAASADLSGIIDTNATQATITLNSVKGPVVSVLGNAQNTTPYSFPLTFGANGVTKVAASQAVDAAALNAYAALWEVDAWVGRFLTPQQAPILQTGIPVRVNFIGPQQAPFCNAFYQQGTLTFYQQGTIQGTTCANTALIKDVMYHEWGHALDDLVGIQPGITDLAFSEGIGDINATLATGDPVLGRGFILNNANSDVRNVQNNAVYPPANAAEQEEHTQGLIIGGSFWDLRQNLVALYGAEEGTNRAASLFFRHLLVTDRYIDSYASVLRLDDNDNNPATRSPSYCSINKAFGKHRLIGAATLETDACLDQDQGLKVRVDLDNGNGSLKIIASSFGASSIVFCEGKVTACPAGTGTVTFQERATPGLMASDSKKFYQADATVQVKDGAVYTLISRNKEGTALGTKTLSFGKRDQSADLSKTLK